MSEPKLLIPKAIARIWENFQALYTEYSRMRPTSSRRVAYVQSLHSVLTKEELKEVNAFFRGELDYLYGENKGKDFNRTLWKALEDSYETSQEYLEGVARRRTITDIVDLSQDLATDRTITSYFRQLLEEGDREAISVLLEAAFGALAKLIQRARTKIGQRSKLDQAIGVFQVLGQKAAQVPDDPHAENQALWCQAVIEMLRDVEV